MRLTAEQHQLVEGAKGQPVDVLDPESDRAYVLLPAELFARVRGLLQEEGVPCIPWPVEPAPGEPMRIKLRELPMPPEAVARAHRHCKKLGVWRRRSVEEVEDQVKLSYYFGGQAVVTLRSKEGPLIVASGNDASEAFGRQFDALSPEERRQSCTWYPALWNDSAIPPRVLFTHENPIASD